MKAQPFIAFGMSESDDDLTSLVNPAHIVWVEAASVDGIRIHMLNGEILQQDNISIRRMHALLLMARNGNAQ